MTALSSPFTLATDVGAPGGPTGVTEEDGNDGIDDPAALFATTVNV
jgi:hypothetical protein